MKIELSEKVFTPREIEFILARLKMALKKGYVQRRFENNEYLLASYSGVEEKGITPKWNIKIYTYSKKNKGHSIVCVDNLVL